jgi:excisionase family DNA binding protein
MSNLMTAEEIARRLHLRPSTIRRWSQEGIIPAMRLSGKVIRFDATAVERALRERAAQNTLRLQEAMR